MSGDVSPRLTAKAAAQLIGQNERTVQGWFVRAGHRPTRERQGYPVPIVAEVLADAGYDVPVERLLAEASVTRVRRRSPRPSPQRAAQPAPDALALRRETELAAQVSALQAALETIAQSHQDGLGRLETAVNALRDEAAARDALAAKLTATEAALDAAGAEVAALTERLRMPWWRRIFRR